MTKDEFDLLLNKCYNNYSHEGEFSVKDWNVIIFRKVGDYADCGAFVSNSKLNNYYFTGWYEEDLDNDLKSLMLDVIKYMFKNGFRINIKVIGELDETECEGISATKLKQLITADCVTAVESFGSDAESLKVTVNKKANKFSAVFSGDFWAWLAVKNSEGFFSNIGGSKFCNTYSIEMKFTEEEVVDFTENAFNYTLDFY